MCSRTLKKIVCWCERVFNVVESKPEVFSGVDIAIMSAGR